jgi:hypothetical protein
MPAPIRLILSEEEDSMLSELRVAQTVRKRTRDRAHMIRLQRFSLEWYTLELGKLLTSCGNNESLLP